jgi:MFS family permease
MESIEAAAACPYDRDDQSILGSSLAFMDVSVVNVALPKLQIYFSATSSAIQWVIQGYALFCAAAEFC